MIIGILKEKGDNRVAINPDITRRLIDDKNEVIVEKSAGEGSYFADSEYEAAGGTIVTRDKVLSDADLFLSILPIDGPEMKKAKSKALYISSFQPFASIESTQKAADAGITALSLDMIPRITIAQTMDVLSSMASIAGYKAVLIGASHLPRYFPMLTTAAGSIPPAKVLILGAGVAGLQAIATARRLGAMVEAFDTRLAAKEEVESLGARFVMVEGATDDKDAGGYAVEQTEEYKQLQRDLIHEHVKKADVVITTALLRGKPAPTLISKTMVDDMKPGSVIVDLASVTGGNCELTKDNETVAYNSVTIIGDSELAAQVPQHASQMYSRNIYNYMKVFLNEGEANIDLENEIMKSSCIVYNGELRYGKTE